MFCAAWSGVKRIGAAEEVNGRRSRWKMDMDAIAAGDVSMMKLRRMQGMRMRKDKVVSSRGMFRLSDEITSSLRSKTSCIFATPGMARALQ